jgi:hypothetical protein
MGNIKSAWISLIAFVLLALVFPVRSFGQQSPSQLRDGQHDFDFEMGTWKTHIHRLVHPLTSSTEWTDYDGTSVVQKVWDGRGNVVELEVSGPAGHIEGLSLRLYNPEAHQWSLNFANSRVGALTVPTVGEFQNGRGEFFDQETFNGRTILVRNIFSDITPNSFHFEQAFSDDGGKTWESNWITDDTRLKDGSAAGNPAPAASPVSSDQAGAEAKQTTSERDGQRDFDFELGSWKMHLRRLLHPLTGSNEWVDFDATSFTRKIWGGRAQLEEFEAEDPVSHRHIEGLTLRLYDRNAHQWNLYWANSSNGVIGVPTVGEFKGRIGEFYDQEPINGKATLVRYVWSDTEISKPRFEQSFSIDGGKTWEPNWITTQEKQ